jgi:N-acetylneuraminate synthase
VLVKRRRSVRIAGRDVGPGHPCFIVAEIGINHNGNLATACQLVDVAVRHGVDAVKLQKRTVDVVYSPEELARPRESIFGTTNGDLKRGLEFGEAQYREFDRYCTQRQIPWFASCWDEASVDFVERFAPPCHKVASACLTDDSLLRHMKRTGRPIVLSTGMSSLEEIDHAVAVLEGAPLVILHSTSTYPAPDSELNLDVIPALRRRYGVPIGYSGHETGVMPSVIAVSLGAVMVERHVTLDRAMWGTDQAASLEPRGVELLTRYIRKIPEVRGDGIKVVYESERAVRKKLRRVGPDGTRP